jgi:hypothetical protein
MIENKEEIFNTIKANAEKYEPKNKQEWFAYIKKLQNFKAPRLKKR